jgi:hypothetical protein
MPMGMGGLGLPGLEGMSVGANPLGISSECLERSRSVLTAVALNYDV